MTGRKLMGAGGLIIALVLLVAINAVSNTALTSTRLDLTEEKLYTLTEGSKNIVRDLTEPITLRFFYSEKLANGRPQIADYARRVEELLREYVSYSDGNLRLEVIDPEPFSDAEEQAVRAGIQGIPVSQTERIYLGLQGVNSVDGRAVIPFFDNDQEATLEYDISELIYDLANPEKPMVVIVTDLPVRGRTNPNDFTNQQPREPAWAIFTELQNLYNVQVIPTTSEAVPTGTDVLMVIHPKGLTPDLEYAIDQYVMGGGNTIVFVDPLAEVDEPEANPQNPMQAMQQPRASDLNRLLRAWGVEMIEDQVVGDRQRAIRVQAGTPNRPESVPMVIYVNLQEEDVNEDHLMTRGLDQLNLISPGALRVLEDAGTEVTALLRTTEDSQLIPESSVRMFPQPKELLAEFDPSGERQLLAALIQGEAKSAFPDGPEFDTVEDLPPHRATSQGPVNVAVFADVDMLADRTWIQVQQFLGMRIPNVFANNGALAINAVDFLSGSDDLISIRGRGSFARPFTLVEEMERQANQDAQEKIAGLEEQLRQTQQRLRELQQQAPEDNAVMIASSELQNEIEKFELEELETQRELRRLQRSLLVEVEQLGNRLKFLHVGLMPLLVGLAAVVLGVTKSKRRRRR